MSTSPDHAAVAPVERGKGEEPDIDVLLREYVDAGYAAGVAETNAGPHAETDPDADRAWERCAALRTQIGTYIVGLKDEVSASQGEREQAALDLILSAWMSGRLTFDVVSDSRNRKRIEEAFHTLRAERASRTPTTAPESTDER